MGTSGHRRMLIIGLDGATFDLIKPWIKMGRLKNMANIMKNGAHGNLKSTIHPLSPQAWTSFMTGRNPGKHGIFGFAKRKSGSYDIQYTNASSRDGKTIWKIIGEQGLKVGVIDVPMTYPPEEVNGFLISGMDSLWEEAKFTYPLDLKSEIEREVGEYRWYPQKPTLKTLDKYIEDIFAVIDNRTEVTKYLMAHKEWEFLTTVYLAPDRVQHTLWRHMDPTHPQHVPEEGKRYGHVIAEVYEKIDRSIGELIDCAGEETNIMIMSDHGAGPYRKVLNLSKWLEMNGLLRFKNTRSSGFGLSNLPRQPFLYILKHFYLGLKNYLPIKLKKQLSAAMPDLKERVVSHLLFSEVDWARTVAYATGNYGNIFINLKGREPKGIVDPDEYESLRDKIMAKLRQLHDPETGEAILDRVYKKEELYKGRYIDQAPDLIILWKDFAYYTRQASVSEEVSLFEPPGKFGSRQIEHGACHRPDGILMMMGKDIKSGAFMHGAEIIDLTPTVFYLMGLPVPADMDGKVLRDAIDDEYLRLHPIKYVEVVEEEAGPHDGMVTYTQEQAKVVQERLKDLGYID